MLLSLNMQFQRILASCHSHQKCQQSTWALPSMMPCTLPYQAQTCVASQTAAYSVSCNAGCICLCGGNYFQPTVCEVMSLLQYTPVLCRLVWQRPFDEHACHCVNFCTPGMQLQRLGALVKRLDGLPAPNLHGSPSLSKAKWLDHLQLCRS